MRNQGVHLILPEGSQLGCGPLHEEEGNRVGESEVAMRIEGARDTHVRQHPPLHRGTRV